jgi:hypothetical protein
MLDAGYRLRPAFADATAGKISDCGLQKEVKYDAPGIPYSGQISGKETSEELKINNNWT